MSAATMALLKEKILAGETLPDFKEAFPNLSEGTLNAYASRVRKSFTPEETEQAGKAKSKLIRRKKMPTHRLSNYHAVVGFNLLKFRHKTGLGKSDFCKEYNFGNMNNISDMENGFYNFDLKDLIRLSDILKVSVEELLRSLPWEAPSDNPKSKPDDG